MRDINGTKIKIGDKVKTQQPAGGFLPPAPAEIGIVEPTIDPFGRQTLRIRYRKDGRCFDQFILLKDKIKVITVL